MTVASPASASLPVPLARKAVLNRLGQSLWRVYAKHAIAIPTIGLCVLIAVNAQQAPALAFWLICACLTFAAFLAACRCFYTDFKNNAHILLARLGRQPPVASPDYVRALFDCYADEFEHHLMVELSYQAPNLILDIIGDRLKSAAPVIADLGCGTGICGPLLVRRAGKLIGVDLSPKMLALARRKNCYDQLAEADITGFLKDRPGAVDVCIAADVLCYFGDLAAVFDAACGAIKPGGLFAFTVETIEAEGWLLLPTGRYAHAQSYVAERAQQAGFSLAESKAAILRTQSGAPVEGRVWLLQKPPVPER